MDSVQLQNLNNIYQTAPVKKKSAASNASQIQSDKPQASAFKAQGATEALSVGLHEIAHLILAGIKAQKPESETRQKFYKMFLRVLNDKDLMQK